MPDPSIPGPRLLVPLLLLLALTAAERWRQRADGGFDLRGRVANLALGLTSSLVAMLLPMSTVAAAAWTDRHGWGLLNALPLPGALRVAAAVVVFDLAIYLQHRAFHRVPMLWRLHRVHHSAAGFNATLGVRFHPLEIVLSLLFKLALIGLVGPPVLAVVAYETLLAAFALLTHADLSLPPRIERVVRRALVTPDWHRVHHAPNRAETDSNYGNALSVWDRLLGTARDVPRPVHAGARFGVEGGDFAGDDRLDHLLMQPIHRRDPNRAP